MVVPSKWVKRGLAFTAVALLAVVLFTLPSLAQGAGDVDTGDTAWVLLSSALVMMMTPAVGLFYGGMVRRKNANSVIVQSFIILALVSLQWVVLGYTLAFGSDVGGVIGGPDYLGLGGVGSDLNVAYAPNIPHMAFVVF